MLQPTVKIAAVLVLVTMSLNSSAGAREDIIARCRKQMSEYGSAMVKACVDQDIEAANSLASYPAKAKPFISRCYAQMREYGWSMVKACVDQDIDAEKSLGGY
jgi:hypothetical protein